MDIPKLCEFIRAFHAQTPWGAIPLSPASLKHGLQAMILAPDQCVFMHENGAIGGQVAPMKFSAELMAQEVFWWAERDGLVLMRAFENWAKEKRAKVVCMASLSDPRVAKFYGRRQYKPAEQFFMKVI